MKAKLNKINKEFKKTYITFEILDNIPNIEYTKDDILELEFKKSRKKRSLNANAYFYELQNQLADKLEISNQELHITLLRDYSECLLIPLLKEQDPNGYFIYYEYYIETNIGDKEAVYYKVYKPTRDMNSKEFSRILSGLVTECIEQGIPTMTDEQINKLIGKKE